MMTRKANLSIFTLVMITIGSVDSIRNLPATALFGSSLIFFFILAAVFFLIPCALVSAELASSWTEEGGIYVWSKAAFGPQVGFIAIWFQWMENIIWYPTILSFVAGTLAYLIAPNLAANKLFLIGVILVAFWTTTLVNLRGMRTSALFSNICGVLGLILPMTLIILLGAIWVFKGKPLQINFHLDAILPTSHHHNVWESLTGIALSFCGMEIATVHARDVKQPQRAFPIALLYSTLIILSTLMFGSLAIAIVLPHAKISLVSGLMQAFDAFLASYHLSWALPLMGISLIIGGMGGVNNWIIAPTRGLLIAGQDGNLPAPLCRVNDYGAPNQLLFYQAIIVSLLALVFLLVPSVNGSYWLLTVLASQVYMLMYAIMFVAAIVLRFKQPNRERPYRIPGGLFGMLVVAGGGLLGTIGVFIVGFMPPTGIEVGSFWHYESLVAIGLTLSLLPPIVWLKLKNNTQKA